jgi:hypothetical protein
MRSLVTLATVRRWCSSTSSPVLAKVTRPVWPPAMTIGSHIQSCGAAHVRCPTVARYRRTRAA